MEIFKLLGKIAISGADEAKKDISDVTGHAEKSSSKLLQTASKIGKWAIAGAASLATAIGGYATKVGSDFEAAMSEVQAISGATGKELDALTEKAKEMGASTKFSASESAEAFKYMAMAGWKTEDMLDGISGVMNLAAASGENLGEVSDIVTDALTAFGLQASDSAHFADVLAAASNNANTNVSMLGGSFKYVAPVAGALGYSIEDVSVALGLMANSGIKAEQAGTSMRAMLTRLAKPTKEVNAAFGKLGIDASDAITNADGSMKPLSETMQILREKMAGLTEVEKASVAAGIAGQEAMSGMLAIVNASDADFDKLTAAIANADGTAQRMADTMNDNLQGSITILKSAVEGFGISLYETFSGKAKKAVDILTGYVSRLTEAFGAGGLSGLLDEFSNVLTEGLNLIIGKLPQFIQVGTDIIMSIGNAIVQNLPVLTDAAIAIVFQLADSLIANLPSLIDGLLQITMTIVQTLTSADFLTQLIETAILLIMTLANGLIDTIPQLIAAIPPIIGNLLAAIIVELPNIIQMGIDLLVALRDGIIQCIPELVAAIPTLIIAFVNGIVNNLDKIILAAPQIIVSLITGIIGAIPELIAALPRVIAAIADTIRNYDWANIGANIVQGLKDGIANMWGNITNWFEEKVNGLVGSVKRVLGIHSPSKVFAGIGEFMAEGLGEGFNEEFASVKNDIEDSMNFNASAVAVSPTNTLQSFAGGTVPSQNEGLLQALEKVYDAIIAQSDKLDNLGIYLDSGLLVGGLESKMDNALGKRYTNSKRLVMG